MSASEPKPVLEDAFSSAARSFASPVRLPGAAGVAGGTPAPIPMPVLSPQSSSSTSTPSSSSSSSSSSSTASISDEEVTKRVQNDKAVMKQLASQQSQALRAITHRAGSDMENWRSTVGRRQVGELALYWRLWSDYMDGARQVNEKLVQYMRTYAVASLHYAHTLSSASALLAPISTGEILDASSNNSNNGNNGSGGGTTTTTTSSSSSSSGNVVMATASRQGHDATVSGRNALSTSVVSATLQELQGQTHTLLMELGVHLVKQVIGDDFGKPTAAASSSSSGGGGGGTRGHNDGVVSSATVGPVIPQPKKTFSKAELEGIKVAPPTDLAGMTYWYDAVVTELKKDGALLASHLLECEEACAQAFSEFESLTHAMMTGDRKSIVGKDLWLAELKYRRCLRALLAIKHVYLTSMASIYERYRRLETVRSESIASAIDAHANMVAKMYDRVSSKAVVDAVKNLNTHVDFAKTVEEESRIRIFASRERHRLSSLGGGGGGGNTNSYNNPEAAHKPATTVATATSEFQAYQTTALGNATTDASPQQHQQQQQPQVTHYSHIHFTLEPAPAVISPFASPLVVRTGLVLRQMGIMKSWKHGIAVLTRDGQLHILSPEEDAATHPDVLEAIYRVSSGGANGYGGSAGHLQAMSSAAVEVSTPPSSSSSSSSSAATPGGGGARTTSVSSALRLPLPALPHELIQYAAAYSARVDDLLPSASSNATAAAVAAASGHAGGPTTSSMIAAAAEGPLQVTRKAGQAPNTSWEITPTTKLVFAPTIHTHAFELSDTKGSWFSANKLVIRAMSQEDLVDWISCLNHAIDVASST